MIAFKKGPSFIYRPGLWLLLVTFFLFLPVCSFDYLGIDDRIHTEHNRGLYPFTSESLEFFWTREYAEVYTPVNYMLWAGLAELGLRPPDEFKKTITSVNPKGDRFYPQVFHTANFLIHLANVFLVFLLLQRLGILPWPSFFGAAMFAFHPLQVEALAWITGLRDVLSMTLMLVSIFMYLEFVSLSSKRGSVVFSGIVGGKWPENRAIAAVSAFISSLFFFIFSTLSKSSSLAEVIWIPVISILILKRSFKTSLLETLPFLIVSIPLTAVFGALNASHSQNIMWVPPWPNRLVIVLDSLGFYLIKLFWPDPLLMNYGRLSSVVFNDRLFFGTSFVALVFVGLLLWLFSKRRLDWLAASGALFIAGVGPILGYNPFIFQHISNVADRYVYMSLFGVAFFIGYFLQMKKTERVFYVLMSVLLVFCSIKTVFQVSRWKDDGALFSYNLKYTPDSALVLNNYANSLEKKGEHQKATPYYHKAAIISNHKTAWNNFGAMALKTGSYDQAIHGFEMTLKFSGDQAWAWNNLGIAHLLAGHKKDGSTSLAKAMELDPASVTIAENMERLENRHPLSELVIIRQN